MNTTLSTGSVVVGVDGSPGSDHAVRWAAAHAAERGRPLVIVHGTVYPVATYSGEDPPRTGKDLQLAGPRVADEALRLALDVSADLQVSTRVATEDPRTLLTEAATGASLLVLGARGHGSVVRLLLGSVSAAMAVRPPCPLVIVRPPRAEADRLPVVVGVDGSDACTGAVGFAFETASWQDRPVEVVYALGVAGSYSYLDLPSNEQIQQLRSRCELRVAESLAGYAERYPEVAVHRTLSTDSAARALRLTSESAYIVVVGTHGRGPVAARFLGSVSRSVVEHAHCTVAVVPPVA